MKRKFPTIRNIYNSSYQTFKLNRFQYLLLVMIIVFSLTVEVYSKLYGIGDGLKDVFKMCPSLNET